MLKWSFFVTDFNKKLHKYLSIHKTQPTPSQKPSPRWKSFKPRLIVGVNSRFSMFENRSISAGSDFIGCWLGFELCTTQRHLYFMYYFYLFCKRFGVWANERANRMEYYLALSLPHKVVVWQWSRLSWKDIDG